MTTWTKNMDRNIEQQLHSFFMAKKPKPQPFVTLSREYGCDGIKLSNLLADRLNKDAAEDEQWSVLTREELIEASDELNEETLAELDKYGHSEFQGYIREAIFGMTNQARTVRTMAKVTHAFAERGRVIFLGGGAPIITKDLECGLHVLYYAPLEWRVQNHAKRWSIDEVEARHKVVHRHGDREAFVKTYLGHEITSNAHYDLTINNEKINAEMAAEIIASVVQAKFCQKDD